MPDIRRILVIGPSNIGDSILMSPVVQHVHERFPEAALTLLTGERAQPLFEGDPRVRQLLCVDDFHGAVGRAKLAGLIWRIRPDALIDLRQTVLPLVWKPWRALRYFRPVPEVIVHARDRHLWRMERQLGQPSAKFEAGSSKTKSAAPNPSNFELRTPSCPVWISDRDRAYVDSLLRRWAVSDARRLVVFCPGARSHIKRWPVERFAELADRLIQRQKVEVVVSGEPDEGPIVKEMLAAMRGRAHSAVGSIAIRQLGALMERAALVLTNDSAALHMACAVSAPVVAIFGPTDFRRYGPTGARDRVIRRRLFCAPCQRALCRFSHECMRFIHVEEVYAAAAALLDGSSARQP